MVAGCGDPIVIPVAAGRQQEGEADRPGHDQRGDGSQSRVIAPRLTALGRSAGAKEIDRTVRTTANVLCHECLHSIPTAKRDRLVRRMPPKAAEDLAARLICP